MRRDVYRRPIYRAPEMPTNRRDIVPPTLQPLPVALEVRALTECHVTPPDVAEHMAAFIGTPGKILEPSAGTGALVKAMIAQGVAPTDITAVEQEARLCDVLRPLGVEVYQYDFEEWAAACPSNLFDAVAMNPPFRPIRRHLAAAWRLLKPGGGMVAIVPAGLLSLSEGFETIEELGPDTFAFAKVRARIIYKMKGEA